MRSVHFNIDLPPGMPIDHKVDNLDENYIRSGNNIGVGDHVMIYPAADGGTEVYNRDFKGLRRQKKLLDSKWQTRLMEYQRCPNQSA